MALAAALIAAVGVALLHWPTTAPPQVAYQVEVRGIATSRDQPRATALAEAFAGTTVRIVARPEQAQATPLALGLYRAEPGQLARINEKVITIERHAGAVTMSAKASELIASEPGHHTLYLAVARPGNLPERLSTRAGESPEELLGGDGSRQVYPIAIRLLAEPTEDPTPQ